MTPREIIAEAWAITKREKSLRKWGFFSSFFETLLNLKLISYQTYFVYEYMKNGQGAGFFDIEYIIYNYLPHWFFWTFVTFLIVLFIIELFIPHLALGAIIGLAAKSHKREKVNGGLVLALYNFFPIFAIHEIFVFQGIGMIITTMSVVVRYMPPDMRLPVIITILFLWLLSNILKFFFSFAEEGVVIRKLGIFEALGKSFKLIVSYLSHVMFLLIMLFVISIRIFINALMIFLIPAFALGLGFLLAQIFSPLFSYSIAGLVGVVLVFFTSYFLAYLHVFKQTVWTLTYLELSGRKELDAFDA